MLHTRDEDHDKGAEGGGGGGGEGGGGGGGRDEEEGKKGNEDRKEFRAGNCGDCNRQYCIDAHLPICKDATVGDVVATCFRASPLPRFISFSLINPAILPPPKMSLAVLS